MTALVVVGVVAAVVAVVWVLTAADRHPCPACTGTGVQMGVACSVCDGKGWTR